MANELDELRQRLTAMTGSEERTKCPMGRLLDELDEDTSTMIQTAMADETIPYTRIHQEIRGAGIPLSKDSLKWHRMGVCYCPEDLGNDE